LATRSPIAPPGWARAKASAAFNLCRYEELDEGSPKASCHVYQIHEELHAAMAGIRELHSRIFFGSSHLIH
jgi:hypothetical protein